MAALVLVPGFWLGAWAWEDVARELRSAGHEVHTVTLTGLAERAGEAGPGTGVQAHIADIVRVIEDHGLQDVVLVGHSGANVPVTGAAARIPGRIARLVFVDTAPLPSGMAVIDFNHPATQERWRKEVAEEGDGQWLPVPPFERTGDAHDLAGLTDEHLARLRERCTPQPFATATEGLDLPHGLPAVPSSLVACTFTPGQLRELAASGSPLFAPLAGMDLHHLPTGHWPMFSRPVELAMTLGGLADR
ncbi:alpha/beta hydrolase [Streptomyces sp. ET3-23]|uniref:alpha/beta hydrolase n=1 Tax=Streptomyces sp. ET3-23 TaxID=2885643 RepID=UPI001D1177CA|nr:alpha/beta fold hydrolase [Streptomyces sp. ET3-23]MCC2279384.1 alpha/beta hydrolase [Streptomyces sp. ET3-23]